MDYGSLTELRQVYEDDLALRIYDLHRLVTAHTNGWKKRDADAYGYEAFRRAWPNRDDFIQNFFWIRSKEVGEVCLLRYNDQQRQLDRHIKEQEAAGKPVRVIVLKARQTGISTYVQSAMAYRALTTKHFRCAVVAHKDESAAEIFEMTDRFVENLPFHPPLRTDRKSEIQTEWDSKYTTVTAGSSNAGRALACH